MQINKIEIYNLNSLKGYWCIDLTDPDYKKNHNQFVICGETGSGKTTILDAITLALYGRTPRQDTGTIEELMTKHTARSMASVTYVCKKGTFKSTFSFWRAREKLDGKLQHSFNITNLDNGEDSGNIKAFDGIEKATYDCIQLKYDQFCRSIMLAQGEFDTFIKGTDRQRADILAKMSGIDYKDIGKQIWYKAKKKIDDYKSVQKAISDVEVLSPEQEIELRMELKGIPEKNNELQEKIEKNNEALNWVNRLNELLKAKNDAATARNEYEKNAQSFAAERSILEKAEKALNCEVAYQKLNQLEKEDKNDRVILETKRKELSVLENECRRLENELKEAAESLKIIESQLSENENLWKKVRNLDSQIESAEAVTKEADTRKSAAKNELESAEKKFNSLKSEITELEDSIVQAENYLKKNCIDKKLENIIPVLKGKKDEAGKNISKITSYSNKLSTAQAEVQSLTQKKTAETESLERINLELKNLVSTEYLSISVMLRNKLEVGKACPVCGSSEHPLCEEGRGGEIHNDQNDKNLQIASKISELNEKIEVYKKNLKSYEDDLIEQTNAIKQAEDVISAESKELAETENLINEKLADFKESINLLTGISILDEKISDFEHRAEVYKQAENIKAENGHIKQNKQTELEGIKLEILQKRYDDAESDFVEKSAALEKLQSERRSLFGEKYVDVAEKAFKEKLKALEEAENKADTDFNRTLREKTGLEGETNQISNKIRERTAELEKAGADFSSVLAQN